MYIKAKPKVLIDIISKHPSNPNIDVFSRGRQRLNLSFKRTKKATWRSGKSIASLIILVLMFGFGAQAIAPIITAETLAQNTNPLEEQRILQEQLDVYEKEIVDLENKIAESKRKGTSLKGEITTLNSKIEKINLQIKAVNLSIAKLNQEVNQTTQEIHETENYISTNKGNLADTLTNIYYNDNVDTIEILLKSNELSEFFGNVNDLSSVQENLRGTLEDLVVARSELLDEKNRLDLAKADKESVKAYQDSQRALVQRIRAEKDTLLKVTKGQESIFKDLAVEKKKAAAEIRNKIFRLLGGGELRFEEAVRIAKVAENATGVRAALILSVLTQESAIDGVIGKNLGKCYYNTLRNNASGTVMSNTQKPVFLAILAELGPSYDPNTTPVSCPISSDGQYGGAMGPAQFMPTTWMLYKNRVGRITGGNPPNPFNNLDAFTATALYLKDGLDGCRALYTNLFSQENCAAAKYYAGGNWRNYIRTGRYGFRVAERAADIEQDIEIILIASAQ